MPSSRYQISFRTVCVRVMQFYVLYCVLPPSVGFLVVRPTSHSKCNRIVYFTHLDCFGYLFCANVVSPNFHQIEPEQPSISVKLMPQIPICITFKSLHLVSCVFVYFSTCCFVWLSFLICSSIPNRCRKVGKNSFRSFQSNYIIQLILEYTFIGRLGLLKCTQRTYAHIAWDWLFKAFLASKPFILTFHM